MTFIIDASFGHAQITPAALTRIGAAGAILYAGCDDTTKNCTPAEVEALLSAGLLVGLVIENKARDMAGGAPVGDYLGRNILAGAKSVGYDTANCVLYTAADWNSQGPELDAVDAAMDAFRQHVPVPGIYGNSYAIDRCFTTGHTEFGWQSDSTSFSYGPSPHACLLQRYNDPRAGGLPVDVNDIQSTPLGLMGEQDMPLTDDDVRKIVNLPVIDGRSLGYRLEAVNDALKAQATQIADLQAALTKVQTGGVDPVAVAQALVAHLDLQVVAK